MYEIQNYNPIQSAGNSWMSQYLFSTYPLQMSTYGKKEFDIDSDGNFYFSLYTTKNIYDHLVFSLDKNGKFRWCKNLVDSSDISKRGLIYHLECKNDIIYLGGNKRITPANQIDYDSFLIGMNKDGSVLFNKGLTDKPRSGALTSYGFCFSGGEYIIQCGTKWSGSYNLMKPHLFIYNLDGDLAYSRWSNTATVISGFYEVLDYSTNVVVLSSVDDSNHLVKYNFITNTVLWDIQLTNISSFNNVAMEKDSEGNIYLYGSDKKSANHNNFIVKIDTNGNILWSKTYYLSANMTSDQKYIRQLQIYNNKIYMLVYFADALKHCLLILDLDGNVEKVLRSSSELVGLKIKDSSMFIFTYSTSSYSVIKLDFDDIGKYSQIKLGGLLFYFEDVSQVNVKNLGATRTKYTNLSFSNASYLTSNIFKIKDGEIPTRGKIWSGVYY